MGAAPKALGWSLSRVKGLFWRGRHLLDGRQVGLHMGTEQVSRKFHFRGLYVICQIGSGVAMKMAELRGGSRRKVGNEADEGHLKIHVRLGAKETFLGKSVS